MRKNEKGSDRCTEVEGVEAKRRLIIHGFEWQRVDFYSGVKLIKAKWLIFVSRTKHLASRSRKKLTCENWVWVFLLRNFGSFAKRRLFAPYSIEMYENFPLLLYRQWRCRWTRWGKDEQAKERMKKQIFQQFSSEWKINFHQRHGWIGDKKKTTAVSSTKLFSMPEQCFH